MSEKHQCKGIKANGEQCTRRATQGDYCKTHSKGIEIAKDNSPACTPVLRLEFESIAMRCMEELERTEKEGVKVQWMKMILDCARYAKEEMRMLEGMGATSEYYFTVRAPKQQDIPVIDVEVDEERVLN